MSLKLTIIDKMYTKIFYNTNADILFPFVLPDQYMLSTTEHDNLIRVGVWLMAQTCPSGTDELLISQVPQT